MAEILPDIHPTRSELLEIRGKIRLSKKGHKLLEEKRDALIVEFFDRIKKLKAMKAEFMKDISMAYKDLIKAESLVGPGVDSLALSMPASVEVDIESANIMGVKIPKFNKKIVAAEKFECISSIRSATLDKSVGEWCAVTGKLFDLVEAEEVLKMLAEEIKKTKRRVNSLEYFMIPRLEATQKYIRSRLEEQERENFFRLKTIKKKKAEGS